MTFSLLSALQLNRQMAAKTFALHGQIMRLYLEPNCVWKLVFDLVMCFFLNLGLDW